MHDTVTKKSASGGHFLYRTLPKMAAEYAAISQEGSNFRKRTAKKFVLPPKFQKVRFEMHRKFTIFLNIYGMYVQYSATCVAWPDLFPPLFLYVDVICR